MALSGRESSEGARFWEMAAEEFLSTPICRGLSSRLGSLSPRLTSVEETSRELALSWTRPPLPVVFWVLGRWFSSFLTLESTKIFLKLEVAAPTEDWWDLGFCG